MPPLDEGDLLYMPTALPGLSVGKAGELLQQTDRMIRTVPEVARVFGKAGRAETATDPAPLEMFETTVQFKPRSQWRAGMTPEASLLAYRTKERRAAVLHDALDDAFAAARRARLALAVINAKVMLEIAERSVGAAMIAQR